jgi:hypothetical protein
MIKWLVKMDYFGKSVLLKVKEWLELKEDMEIYETLGGRANMFSLKAFFIAKRKLANEKKQRMK